MTKSFLRNGWHLVKFGDYVRKVNTRIDLENSTISRYVAGEHMDTDNLRITRWGIVGDGYLGPAFITRFVPGQVLYGSRRTYLRKVALADFEGICANTTFVLEPKSEKLLNDFLAHVMSTESFHSYSISKSKGSVNPYINFVDLKDYEFVLPPVAEQKQIVKVLSLAGEAIDLSNKTRTDELKVSLLHSIFSNKSFPTKEISGFAEISVGGIWGSTKGIEECDVEIVRQTEFRENASVAIGSGEIRSIPELQLVNRQLKEKDILVQKSAGTPTLCGRVVQVKEAIERPVVCSNFLHMLRIKGSAEAADYVFSALWYLHRIGRVFDLQRGTSIRNLDMGRYLKQHLPDLPNKELAALVTQIKKIERVEMQRATLEFNLKVSNRKLRETLLLGASNV